MIVGSVQVVKFLSNFGLCSSLNNIISDSFGCRMVYLYGVPVRSIKDSGGGK